MKEKLFSNIKNIQYLFQKWQSSVNFFFNVKGKSYLKTKNINLQSSYVSINKKEKELWIATIAWVRTHDP